MIQTSYAYEPFGLKAESGQPTANPYTFTAREDDGTGLYYYRARYYHSTIGRFVSEDPVEYFGGDVNLFAYVANDPIDGTDPFGLTNDPEDFGVPQLPPGYVFVPDNPYVIFYPMDEFGKCFLQCMGIPITLFTSENVGLGHVTAKGAARVWYGLVDGRFSRWGKYSKVLVPKLATKISAVMGPVGWGIFALEGVHCYEKCKDCK